MVYNSSCVYASYAVKARPPTTCFCSWDNATDGDRGCPCSGAPLPVMVVKYYRAAIAPLRDLLHWLLPFALPEWYIDLVVATACADSPPRRFFLTMTVLFGCHGRAVG
jgi:hypothetical protein